MAEKGNDRSNAKISDEDIMRILEKKGEVKVFAEDYKVFSAGKSDIKKNQAHCCLYYSRYCFHLNAALA